MIHIIDYGLGNTQAFVNMFKRLGFESTRATSADQLINAKKLILPGVGSFDHAMTLLNGSGMRETIDKLVLVDKCPVLGICVGMQMLASSSSEGTIPGLGWIPGNVRSFRDNDDFQLPLPHMGWNDIEPELSSPLYSGSDDWRFYFLHSYYFECENSANALATANYGIDFTCSVSFENIYGVQFHPEKSHHWGAKLLKNFAEL